MKAERTGIPQFLQQLVSPPLSATVETTFGAQSRRGKSRKVNEDHYIVLRLGRQREELARQAERLIELPAWHAVSDEVEEAAVVGRLPQPRPKRRRFLVRVCEVENGKHGPIVDLS